MLRFKKVKYFLKAHLTLIILVYNFPELLKSNSGNAYALPFTSKW
jgi:hypothetical protein